MKRVLCTLLLACIFLTEARAAEAKRLLASEQQVRVAAGGLVALRLSAEGLAFVRTATRASSTVSPAGYYRVSLAADRDQESFFIAVPPTMPSGTYEVKISVIGATGEERTGTIQLDVDPFPPVPQTTRVPVLLLNGWQTLGLFCDTDSTGTFGQLQRFLETDGSPVRFFDNCQYGDLPIEDLGGELGRFISSLRYTDGSAVPRVDIVAHSMGGLITRAYLAGKQAAPATFFPPANPKVRKLVTIATPHFGSFLAVGLGVQAPSMQLGSRFLWDLVTWNQGQDDLRGVDAIAIAGNAGAVATGSPRFHDGVVSLLNASLAFVPGRGISRTRIVPYCHTGGLASLVVTCDPGSPLIAKVDSPSHLTWEIIRSFLADLPAWQFTGTSPVQDPFMASYRALMLTWADNNGNYYAPGRQLQASLQSTQGGPTYTFNSNAASPAIYAENILKASYLLNIDIVGIPRIQSPVDLSNVYGYGALPLRFPPAITSVRSTTRGGPGLTISSGSTITVSGFGFVSPSSGTRLLANGAPLSVATITDQQITAFLPNTYNGLVKLTVSNGYRQHTLNVMAAPPQPPSIALSTATMQFSYILGGPFPPGQTVNMTNSGGGTLSWTASSSAGWLLLTPASGTAPSSVSVSVNPAGLGVGVFNGAITISSPGIQSQTVAVTLRVSAAPPAATLTISSVVNAASFRPGVVPGGLATVFGKNLSTVIGVELPGGLPSYKGVTVTVQGRPVPILGVANVGGQEQINFQAPFDLVPSSPVRVAINNNGSTGALDNVTVVSAQPGIFEYVPPGSGVRYAAVIKTDGSVVGPANPLSSGDAASIYLTGMGVTLPLLQTGQFGPSNPPTVTFFQPVVGIGGMGAQVLFSGYAPGFLGLYQINIMVPDGAPKGPLWIWIS